MLRRRIHLILLILALLVPTAIVLAAGTVTLGNFRVDLVSHVTNGDDTDTFTYAVTAINSTQALSHWTLGIDTCLEHLVSPEAGSYTTVTDIAGCSDGSYSCEESNYTVVLGNDPTLGINGIKFEDGTPQLTNPNTHVFEITVSDFAYLDTVPVGLKDGSNAPKGMVDGPVCGTGTAVSLASSNVGTTQTGWLLPVLLSALVLLAMLTLFTLRRQPVTVRAE